MRILVVGAGATGGYFGGRLMQAGRDVTFLVRPARAHRLQERGLRIVGLGENTVLTPKLVLAGEITGPFDLVLLTVKAAGLEQSMEDMAPAVGPETLILPVLNGIRHIDALAGRFGEQAVLGGLAFLATTINADGDILRLAELQGLTYGARGTSIPRLGEIDRVLSDAGFPTTLSDDITEDLWAKWVFIASTAAVTCLMRGTIGDVVAVPGGAAFAKAIVAEAAAVAVAAGYPVPGKKLENVVATVTAEGSPTTASMYRDLVAGLGVEVEQIFGDLVRRAAALGVPVPLLDLVTLNLRVHQRRLAQAR
jgi:2-dehydropantoate 2-reductase